MIKINSNARRSTNYYTVSNILFNGTLPLDPIGKSIKKTSGALDAYYKWNKPASHQIEKGKW